MGLEPVYLIIQSETIGKKDKPWFRIASTELPNMPRVFTGYNEKTNKYQDIIVQPPPTGEEWKVILEFNNRPDEDVKIMGWAETHEEAGKQLSDGVLDALKPAVESGQNVRQSWKHEVDGNVSCTYHIKNPRKLSDASTQDKTYYWWEVVRVEVQNDDYGPEWHEKNRIEYMEKSAQIALDTLRKGELTAQEEAALEERRRSLGNVPLSAEEFKSVMGTELVSDEEMDRRMAEIDRDSEEDDSDIGGREKGKAKGSKYGTVVSGEQLDDPEIMGTE